MTKGESTARQMPDLEVIENDSAEDRLAKVEKQIRAIAFKAIEKAGSSIEAKARLLKMLPANVREAWTEILLDMGADQMIRRCTNAARNQVAATINRDRDEAGDPRLNHGKGAVAYLYNRGVYEWPLPGNIALGEATLEQVKTARQWFAANAKTYTARAALMDAVEKAMQRKKAARVRDALKETDLERMFKETGNA